MMGVITGVSWCDHTFNGWWGCVPVSPGCEHCYAERQSKRFGPGIWASHRFFGEKHWNEPRAWNKKAKAEGIRRRVFCGSMCDVFEDRPDLVEWRGRLWSLIVNTPNLDWLLLTKRPENVLMMCPHQIMGERDEWIPPNVWIGVTAENQEMADKRIPLLLDIPATVRFVSVEPMLEQIDILQYLTGEYTTGIIGANWVICGGESGSGARPMNIDWARDLCDQCEIAGTPFFMKQLSGTKKNLEDFPWELRVREFPSTKNPTGGTAAGPV